MTGQSANVGCRAGDGKEKVAGSGGTAQFDRRQGPQPGACRGARPRRRPRWGAAGRAAGEVEPAQRRRGAAGRRRAAGRPLAGRGAVLGPRAGDPPARRQHRRARAGGEGLQHLGAGRGRRRGHRRLPQDPHVRRRRRRSRLPGVGARAARRGARNGAARRPDRRADGLLRPPVSGAVPDPRRARRPPGHGPLRIHRRHRPRPLGGAVARPGDREPDLRHRPEPDRRGAAALRLLRTLCDRRSLGRGPRQGPRRGVLRRRRARPRARRIGSASRCRRWPIAGPAAYAWPQEVHA